MMELDDCAFPLLAGMEAHSDPAAAFKDTDIALLVGARPRGPGMERKDLLAANAQIFTAQGKALDKVASRNVKVLVVGNPANTNAYIAMKSAPSLPKANFTAMMRLDHNRALSQLAAKTGKPVAVDRETDRVGQPLADDVSRTSASQRSAGKPAKPMVDDTWYRDTYIPTVGKRGAAIIEARGLSSAASAANAAIDHIRDWVLGTQRALGDDGRSVRRQLRSAAEDIIYGVPCVCAGGKYEVVRDLAIDEFSRGKMDNTLKELLEERDGVKHLLG